MNRENVVETIWKSYIQWPNIIYSFNYIPEFIILGCTSKNRPKHMGLVRNILWIDLFVTKAMCTRRICVNGNTDLSLEII